MRISQSQTTGASVLKLTLKVMQPLVRWLVRSGVGHTEFASALKPVFLDEARRESQRIGGKQTDSALSLLSGLHRKDVKGLSAPGTGVRADAGFERASLPTQVVARWLATALPEALPLGGPAPSFESLVRSVSTDVHPRAVQHELLRLGVAELGGPGIRLRHHGFTPDPSAHEARALLASSAADHLAAGVHNLTGNDQRKYLEQTVFADGLSRQSARQLEQLSNQLWHDAMTAMITAAVPLCEQDEPHGGDQRLRLGMFCYSEAMDPAPGVPAPGQPPTMQQPDPQGGDQE